jgi:hypothetical protein
VREYMQNNKDISKIIRDIIVDSVFCYSLQKEQGFTSKANCQCYLDGKTSCEAYLEKMEFYKIYEELEKQDLTRSEILKEVEKLYQWKLTSWIQYNVTK